MESVEYLGFLIEVVSPEPGTYEYSVFDMTGEDKPEFSLFETDDVEFVSYEAAVDDAKSWIRDFLFNDEDRAAEHIEKLYTTKKALSGSPSVETKGRLLQKLTTDVFNRSDCPDWARYAAVDINGTAHYYDERPYPLGTSFYNNRAHSWSVEGEFDASDWKNSLIERPVVLQKLTVDVFDRPDCPKWAKYASVNSRGNLIFFGDKPRFEGEDYGCWSCSYCAFRHRKDVVFDATDWENSLIERPAKKETLPDWCGDGAFGWENGDYFRLEVIDADHPVTMKYLDDGSEESVSAGYIAKHVKQARLRSYNAEEMPELVGKVVKFGPGLFSLCLRVKGLWADFLDDCYNEDDHARINSYDCDMLKYQNTIDGKPCAVLEHLNENGEWVE